eukprot:Skav211461  [mRNA]  locus=scaffold379:214811:230882:- [translate_table: standard]
MKALLLTGHRGGRAEGAEGHSDRIDSPAVIAGTSAGVFRLFDRLHFLIDGRTAYFGPLAKLEEYFANIGYTMPDHTMPADFVMRLRLDAQMVGDAWWCIDPRDPEGDAWDKQWPNEDARVHGAPVTMLPKEQGRRPGYQPRQVRSLRQRPSNQLVRPAGPPDEARGAVIMKVRSKADLRSALLRTLVLGVLFGLTFLRIEKTQSVPQLALFTISGCVFFTIMMGVMNICMAASMGIPTRLPTLIREHRNGAYGVPAMYLSKALADAPFDLLISLIWSSLMFWMIGFRDDFVHFFYFFLGCYVLTLVATGVGYLGGYAAPVAAIGMLVVLLNVMPQMLFGGLFINLNSVPAGFVWLKTISMFRLGFEALMINQWQDYGDLDCSAEPFCLAADGEAVLATNGIDPEASYAQAILFLLIPLCRALKGAAGAGRGVGDRIYHILAFLVLWRRAQPKQFEGAAPEDDTKGELRRDVARKWMLVKVGDSEEQPKLSSIERPEILLQWQNLSVEAARSDVNGSSKQVHILQGNAGAAAPGELLAIMGPSGSGKSTLLKSLAGIAELPLSQGMAGPWGVPGVVGTAGRLGWLELCQQPQLVQLGVGEEASTWREDFTNLPRFGRRDVEKPDVREHSAFLFQDEQLFANLTVREHLLFQCRMPKEECMHRADALILELGLTKCKNTLIGSIGAGISGTPKGGGWIPGWPGMVGWMVGWLDGHGWCLRVGSWGGELGQRVVDSQQLSTGCGERRRLAFATELLTEPTVLFADEATSGLDSAMAPLGHGGAVGGPGCSAALTWA